MMALSQHNNNHLNHHNNNNNNRHHYRSKSTPSSHHHHHHSTSTTRTSVMQMPPPPPPVSGVICVTNDSTTVKNSRGTTGTLQYQQQSSSTNNSSSNTFDRMSARRTSSSSSSMFINGQIPASSTTTTTSCSINNNNNNNNNHRYKSPFSRGQSRVFYASEVGMWDHGNNDRRSPPPAPHTTPSSSLSGSGQFRRSDHRSNSSYKSQDSGFSDSVVEVGPSSLGTTTASVVDDSKITNGKVDERLMFERKTDHHSPAKKLAKWSSSATSPLKMFWRQQDGSRLSVLKCCAGMNPLFPFYNKQIKSPEPTTTTTTHEGSTEIHFTPNQNNNSKNGRETVGSFNSLTPKDESRKMSSSVSTILKTDNNGTWPRVRKTTTARCHDSDDVVNPSSAPPPPPPQKLGTYYSTRLKGHKKPRVLFQETKQDVSGLHSQAHFRDTLFVGNSSVQLWLRDLHWSTEGECMNTLQSKAVARDLADVSVISTRNANDAILLLCRKSFNVKNDLKKLKRKIDKKLSKSALCICDGVSLDIQSLLSDCRSQQFKDVPAVQKYLRLVFAHCGILKQLLDRIKKDDTSTTTTSNDDDDDDDAPSPLDAHFALETAFDNLFDALVLCHLKNIVDTLEDPLSVRSAKTAVTCIGLLGAHDSVLCHLIAKTGAIRSLLTICIERKYRSIRSLILRSLAMLCCNDESIRELEESGGIECITEILAEKDANEAEKCEAAGVVAQITSPLLDNSPTVMGLTENIPSLIQSLTELAGSTKSYEGFLLSTAAIGNLTFMASNACQHLHECKTTFMLVSACRQGKKKSESVFVKDQVATILANMASIPKGRDDIIQSGGLVVLLCFLQIRPSMVQSKAEVAACERVQQKSAIALSRLCSDVKIAEQVVSLQGVQRLVRLCKDEKERNESDAVLVACLAVLRKIASVCGLEEFKDLDATELVEPRLLDSFLIYSSRQESYV